MTDVYREGAVALSVEAARQCLEGWPIDQVGSISLASCTGYECPAISYHLHQRLGLPAAAEHVDSIGTGCQGAGPALRSAYLYARETGGMALAVATEICSACDFPEPGGVPRPDGRYELLRAKAIFGDGAAAALVGYDDDPSHPYFVDFESHFDARYMDYLGFRWVDRREAL
ncbi:MAG: hypothetical protein Q8O40_14830, partial [Chloroflexota bacterium]|nr:hypothetical protein [Chloroflexota bacterium]